MKYYMVKWELPGGGPFTVEHPFRKDLSNTYRSLHNMDIVLANGPGTAKAVVQKARPDVEIIAVTLITEEP